ncbi:TagA domain-containing protein [Rheinheimera sp. WS51]|uniref:TagA domain-containing protein n=1 Tax=Rheinheimera sp. WS51 TaxID=3425886 RepID=UPI003D89C4B4
MPAFESGYKKWNTKTGQYESYSDNNNRPAPVAAGVAVATILGGYDPVSYNAVIYPVFHGNYGNLFNLPTPDLSSDVDQCWLEVTNAENEQKLISIAATRHNPSSINQLHVNLAAEFRPTLAILRCQHNGLITELTRTIFDSQIPALPELAIVGQEHGFNQLKQREFADIESELSKLSDATLVLPTSLAIKVDSYELAEILAALSAEQRAKLVKILAYRAAAKTTSLLLRHAEAESLPKQEAAARLKLHLQKTGLLETDKLIVTGSEIHGNGLFFDGQNGENARVELTDRASVDPAARATWFRDVYGRLHLTMQPWLCAAQVGNSLILLNCSTDNVSQRWEFHNDNELILKNVLSSKCLDYDRANARLIPYSCHGGWNQQWNGVVNITPLWLALLDGQDIKQVMQLLAE